MKPGDLLECPDGNHLIVDWYNRQSNLFTVYNNQNQKFEVPGRYECKIIANPKTEWPFITCPRAKAKGKLVTEVAVPARNTTLTALVDWVVCDGTIYLAPTLNLRLGELVRVSYFGGLVLALPITQSFGTAGQRAERIRIQNQPPKSLFDRIMDDDL